jgi:hypothetical protein
MHEQPPGGCRSARAPDRLRPRGGRHGWDAPAVVLPARDLAARDLALLCALQRLRTAPRAAPPAARRGRATLNALATTFVVGLQVCGRPPLLLGQALLLGYGLAAPDRPREAGRPVLPV